MTSSNTIPPKSKTSFCDKMNEAVMGGCVVMGLALGSEMGLFKAMSQFETWATSTEIAEASNCKERYVHEWLYHMTSCGVVQMHDDSETFILPQDHRECLNASPEEGSFVRMSRHLLGLACAFPQLTNAFKKEGPNGIDFKVSRHLLTYWEADRNVDAMLLELTHQMPEELRKQLGTGIICCDVGGGNGGMVISMASRFPNSHFVDCDFSQQALDEGQAKATQHGITNVSFTMQNVMSLPDDWIHKFDYITLFDVLHDLPNPTAAVQSFYKMLKPGGYMSVVDMKADSNPHMTVNNNGNAIPAQVLYSYSLYHCMSASLNYPGSEGLGTCVGHQRITSILNKGGFTGVQMHGLLNDIHFLCKKLYD